jgi:hypothetical protein
MDSCEEYFCGRLTVPSVPRQLPSLRAPLQRGLPQGGAFPAILCHGLKEIRVEPNII